MLFSFMQEKQTNMLSNGGLLSNFYVTGIYVIKANTTLIEKYIQNFSPGYQQATVGL